MNKKFILLFIIFSILSSTVLVYASYAVVSNSVIYNANDSSWNVNNVKDAIDDLYSTAESIDMDDNATSVVWEYNYKKEIRTFEVPMNGTYKLEVWGAYGGNDGDGKGNNGHRGYGGYSVGNVSLTTNDTLYIATGGAGYFSKLAISNGGYNGGGNAYYSGSGGGATHIAINNNLGELKNYVNNQANVLIVAGGGGGAQAANGGGDGGGFIGGPSTCFSTCTPVDGATQNTGNAFGLGQSVPPLNENGTSTDAGGGGGGWYGGYYAKSGGSGGSGYIGSNMLSSKKMVCFNCETSNETSTKTEVTDCHNSTPTADCAKEGNGYARITYIGNS